jgi:hypothetical protein
MEINRKRVERREEEKQERDPLFFLLLLRLTLHHLLDELLKGNLPLPAKLSLGLGRVTEEKVDLSRTEVSRVDGNKDTGLVLGIHTLLVDALTDPLESDTNGSEGLLAKLLDGVRLTSGKNKVIGDLLLEHEPHALNVVLCVAPITLGVEVTKVNGVLETTVDTGDGTSDLTGHESRTTPGGLVVEKDTIAGEHAVSLTVVDALPEGILLGNGVRGTRVERSGLLLRGLLDLTVKLRGRSLVELALLLKAACPNGVEESKGTKGIDVGSVLAHLEGNLDVGLSAKVVDLVGLNAGDELDKVGRVGKVTVLEEKTAGEKAEGRKERDNGAGPDGESKLEACHRGAKPTECSWSACPCRGARSCQC